MKKTLMILALVMFSFANAQKGTVLVMGNIGFSSQKQGSVGDETTYDVVTFSPKVGYQLNDNWTVGVESSVVSSKSIFKNGEAKQNDFSLGSFIRYAKPIGGIFSAYVDLGTGFKNSKRSNYNEGDLSQGPSTFISKTNGFYIAATPAIFLDMNKGFGLNFNIGGMNYNSVKDNNSNPVEYKRFDFNFGKAFSIGLSKNF